MQNKTHPIPIFIKEKLHCHQVSGSLILLSNYQHQIQVIYEYELEMTTAVYEINFKKKKKTLP